MALDLRQFTVRRATGRGVQADSQNSVEVFKPIAKTQRCHQRLQCPPKYTDSKHFQQ